MKPQSLLKLLALAAVVCVSPAALAQTNVYWDGSSTSTITTVKTQNWTTTDGGQVDPTSAQLQQGNWFFNSTGTVSNQPGSITVNTFTPNSITFRSATTFSIISSANMSIQIGAGGITAESTSGTATFGTANLTINLGAGQSWTNNSTNLLTIGGLVANGGNLLTVTGTGNTAITRAISGGGGLTKEGTGNATLSGANSYLGETTITSGTLVLDSTGTLGTATTLNFGVANASSGVLSVGNSSFSFTQTINLNLATVSVSSGSWNLFTGAQFGSGDLTLTGLTSTGATGLTFLENTPGTWSGTDASNRTWSFTEADGVLAVVPEPMAVSLLIGGLLVITVFRRRRA